MPNGFCLHPDRCTSDGGGIVACSAEGEMRSMGGLVSSAASVVAAAAGDDQAGVMPMPRRMALLLAATLPAIISVASAPIADAADDEAVVAGGAVETGGDPTAHIPVADVIEPTTASVGSPANPSEATAARVGEEEEYEMVGSVRLVRYRDDNSGWSVGTPEGWTRDQPKANTPEFHPKSEYGGRRFRVEVTPVGRVSGGQQRLAALADTEVAEILARGYETPESYAAVEATKLAPVDGSPKAIASPNGGVSSILAARVSPDGRYYYYEYRVESIYPLHYWGVSALGPGQAGGSRKLGRRDVVSIVCQMPEDKATPEDYQLLQAVVDSFRVDDFQAPGARAV